LILTIFFCAAFPVFAAENADKVTVESVKGPAQYCDTSGGKTKWVALKRGDKLGELTIIRTGFGAKVVLHFKDDTRVTIHGAAKMGIREFKKSEKVTKTQLGLKYGVIKARVDSTRNPNDFKVKVHNTTLAVTGTGLGIGAFFDLGALFTNIFGSTRTSNQGGSRSMDGKGQQTDNKNNNVPPPGWNNQPLQVIMGITRRFSDFLGNYGGGRAIFTFLGGDPTRWRTRGRDGYSGGMTQIDPPSLQLDNGPGDSGP
jgi:hypothetical protein